MSYKILWYLPAEFESVQGGAWTQIKSMFDLLQDLDDVTVEFHQEGRLPQDYDLVHIFRADFSLWPLTVHLQSQGIPYWVTPIFYSSHQASAIQLRLTLSRWVRKIYSGMRSNFDYTRDIVLGAERVLANTQEEIQLIGDAFGVPSHRFDYLKNGIHPIFRAPFDSLDKEHHLPTQNYFLTTGQLSNPRKNTLQLLLAFREIGSDHPLLLIGDFNSSTYSQKCLAIIHACDHIFHLSKMNSHSHLYLLSLRHAQCYVQASLFETPGLSALEASAMGTPVITTPFGGTRDYFEGRAIFLKGLDSLNIIRAIREFDEGVLALHDPCELDQFIWSEVVVDLLRLYRQRMEDDRGKEERVMKAKNA